MMSTLRPVASRLRRHCFSGSSTNGSATPRKSSPSSSSSPPSPSSLSPPSDNASGGSSPPPWINRWLRLWDRESGTHEILQLKRKVNRSSLAFDEKQRRVSRARATLDRALRSFEESQARHNRLLQSRERWTPSQAMEFAKLLEGEVRIRTQLDMARNDLATSEAEMSRGMHLYMNDLRRRYHEEQLWQDKWRIYSTFGTWGLIVLNSVVFLISQYLWRVRETQRMKDIKGLLKQSLAVNEGTLRVVREQGQDSRKSDVEGGVVEWASGLGENCVKEEVQSADASNGDASRDGTLVAAGEGANGSDLETAPSLQPQSQRIATYWNKVKPYMKHSSNNLDVPSAVLGASVTCTIWLAMAFACPPKGDGPP